MTQSDDKLRLVAEQIKNGVAPQNETVRSFLAWFNVARRGYRATRRIRGALRRHGLTTDPDFEWAYIDRQISFQKAPPDGNAVPDDSAADPTYRINFLSSANRVPVSVKPDSTFQQVVTVLLTNDFSQVPVMTGPRDVKGVISWKSIGTRLALKRPADHARDCMEDARILNHRESLFSAISIISDNDYVLVEANDKSICGIITASDLNDQFQLLAEPFLLVGEIENGVRRLLHAKFTLQELNDSKAPGDDDRKIETPADLTFGEYIRLIDNPGRWIKLKLEIDRVALVSQLNRVRDIRNDVMHFDPDGLDDDDLKFLREFAAFLKRLREVGAV